MHNDCCSSLCDYVVANVEFADEHRDLNLVFHHYLLESKQIEVNCG